MPAELATTLTATDAERLMQAEDVVRAYCGWHIAPSRTEVVVLDGRGAGVLLLPSLYVTAIVSVTQEGEAVAAEDYTFTLGGVLRYVADCDTTVEVEMTHGYDAPPPSVTAVVQAMATRAVNNPGSLVRTQVGPFADTYSQSGFNQSLPLALLDAERQLLAPYALPKRL